MADTLMVGCGCFRLRNSDVSELSINYTHKGRIRGFSCCLIFTPYIKKCVSMLS